MPKFIITHGAVLLPKTQGKQRALGLGDALECTDEERAHLDPSGTMLVTEAVWAEMQKAASAHAAVEEAARKAADNPKASSSIPAKTLKAIAALKGTQSATPPPAPGGAKGGGK